MTFFNKKQEVIDLELTPFGEQLLSEGSFEPVYYAFFDDDVLYDAGGAANAGEVQNEIEARIQDNTPSRKAQYIYKGVETNVDTIVAANRIAAAFFPEIRQQELVLFPPLIDGDYSLIEPLGSMEIGSENAPSWDIRVLKGELSGAINYLTSSADNGENSKVQRIPQLDFDVSYKVAIGWGPAPGDRNIIGGPYNDGTYLYLPEGIPELIFSVDEKNASNETEYDIEVYEVNTVGKQRILTPKLFREKIPIVVDGLLLDNEERAAILRDERPPTEDMVRYYFNIDTDLDIPEEQICELIQHLKTRGVQVDDIPYDCPEILPVGRFNIYESDASGEEC